MSSVEEHRSEAPATVRCMIITVSDTRTRESDTSGQLIRALLEQANFEPLMTKVTRFLGSPFKRREIYQANPVVPTVRVRITQ